MLRLDGKTAFITGCGASGPAVGDDVLAANGQAIAITLARQGARIFGIDRNPEALARTAEQVREAGGAMETFVADVTDGASVAGAVAACVEAFGTPDILINNVGQSEPGDPGTMSHEVWSAQLRLNLDSAFLTLHEILPLMEAAGGGAVVNISSIAGLRYIGKPQVAYSAAKAALMQMTKTTAVIYADRGIRLNCVVPGLIATPLVRRLADKYAGGDYAGFTAHRDAQVPMGRMGRAWDVAYAVLFLASDESRYITAQCLTVDGGITETTP